MTKECETQERGTQRVRLVAGLLTGTLMFVTGCDKAKALARDSVKDPNEVSSTGPTASVPVDLSTAPKILFEVFGEREDPRMVPVAVILDHRLRNIRLSSGGWHEFDRQFGQPGKNFTVYEDGHPVGTATVKQGMWSDPTAPVYSLPDCHRLIPMSSVTLGGSMHPGITVEYIAANSALTTAPSGIMLPAQVDAKIARDVSNSVASGAGVATPRLDSLDFHALAINTGATNEPTIVSSFIDPNADEAAAHGDATLGTFVIADHIGDNYTPTFSHVVNGPAAHADYLRYVDHLDLDGDGVDELLLEGWTYGGDSYLVVLKYSQGRWHEIFRGMPNWCLDNAS